MRKTVMLRSWDSELVSKFLNEKISLVWKTVINDSTEYTHSAYG